VIMLVFHMQDPKTDTNLQAFACGGSGEKRSVDAAAAREDIDQGFRCGSFSAEEFERL